MSGTSKYGFSEEDEHVEAALTEFMDAAHAKDHSKMMQALNALIDCINLKDANETHEEPAR